MPTRPQIDDASRDTYDYICNNCNPNVMVLISGSVLHGKYFDLIKTDKKIKEELQSEIALWQDMRYCIFEEKLKILTGEIYNEIRNITFDSWMNGRIAGNVNLYIDSLPNEIERINGTQREIFEGWVREKTNALISEFESILSKSSVPTRLREKEIKNVKTILLKEEFDEAFHGRLPTDTIKIGGLEEKVRTFTLIQEYFDLAVEGKREIGFIPSPNIKKGNYYPTHKIEAVTLSEAYIRFLQFLESQPNQTTNMSTKSVLYDIALSFAGENREYVNELANILKTEYKLEVFYDKFEEVDLWGKNLYQHLNDIYKNQAKFCIIFISEHYVRKAWTRHELQSAQARAFREVKEYILPVRFDDTEVPGLDETVGYLDIRTTTPESLAYQISRKVKTKKAN